MSAAPATKRQQRLDGTASPVVGRSFSVLDMEDFEAHIQEESEDEEEPSSSTHPEKLLDIVDCAMNNAATLMEQCGFNSLYERGETSRCEEQNAYLAKTVLQSCQDQLTAAEAEYVSIRNVFTRVGIDFKYHLDEVLDGEPPLCNARYHQEFLRTPWNWERPCSIVNCEGKEIIDAPLREFLLPKENEVFLESVEVGRPVYPDRKPICLLCDRRITSMFARQHEANNPLYKYTDESTYKVGNVELLSSNGYPLTINSHQVVHGEPGGYLSSRLIPSTRAARPQGS